MIILHNIRFGLTLIEHAKIMFRPLAEVQGQHYGRVLRVHATVTCYTAIDFRSVHDAIVEHCSVCGRMRTGRFYVAGGIGRRKGIS